MPYNRRPPAESVDSAASVFAPFQPGVPDGAKEAEYKNKPLPGDADAPQRQRVGELSATQLQEAAERDEPPAKVEKRRSISSLVAATVRDQYEPARMQAPRDLTAASASKPVVKSAAKPQPKPAAKPAT